MGPLAAAAAVVSAGLTVMSSIQQASAARSAGAAQQAELSYQAAQGQQQAGQALATGQSQAAATATKTALLESRARAAAGASGGGVTDPSVVTDIARIGQRGDYDALAQLYTSQERAAALTEGANLAVYQGVQAKQAGDITATGDIMKGVGSAVGTIAGSQGVTSMYNKYAAPFLPSWMGPNN